MLGSATAPGRSGTRVSVPVHIAFHRVKSVGTRDEVLSRLNILAYAIPCERFKLALAGSPCITRGRGGWLGLAPWTTFTSYPLPAYLAHTANADRATVRQRKTGRPVRFELTEQTRQAIDAYIRVTHSVR